MYYDSMMTPVGQLVWAGDDAGVRQLMFGRRPEPGWRHDAVKGKRLRDELEAYFAGELVRFEVEVAPEGTAFQQRVWRALRAIPFGATDSYGAVARRLGAPKASRAVGAANARNPIAIVIPCHRVIGQDGSLTGYAFGVDNKRWLLEHERRYRSGASG